MSLEQNFEKIDQRNIFNYRFDLDKDIKWNELNHEGLYFSDEYLEKIGLRTEALNNNIALRNDFQQYLALCFCETFIHFETEVIEFIKREYKDLGLSMSAFYLIEEEVKHTHLFSRYAKFLLETLPENFKEDFKKNYVPPKVSKFEDVQKFLKSKEEFHCFFWMSTIFFEEFTIHFFDQMKNNQSQMNPIWYKVHQLHRQEEIQHVVTDRAYFESLDLDNETKRKISKYFFLYLKQNFEKYLSLDSCKKTFSSHDLFYKLDFEQTGFFQELLHSSSFRQLRKSAPYLNEYAALKSQDIPNAPLSSNSCLIGEPLDIEAKKDFSVINWLYEAAETNKKITFCLNTKGEEVEMSYSELLELAKGFLSYLRNLGIKKESYVILFLSDPKEIIPVFWSCLLGGMIPTIICPPVPGTKGEEELNRLKNVSKILGTPWIIHSGNEANLECLEHKNLLNISDIRPLSEFVEPTPSYGNELCFLQFSSGSTRSPKGVKITHFNLFANIESMRQTRKGKKDLEVFVSWLPLYHDMGLIGYHLCPIALRSHQILMKPSTFIRKPLLWVEKISEHKGTQTATPNFGMNLVLKHLRKAKELPLDLSSMESFLIGAEPISSTLMDEFLDEFKKYGLKKFSLCPAYGLAEGTLAMTMTDPERGPESLNILNSDLKNFKKITVTDAKNKETMIVVNSGKVVSGSSLRVVGEKSEVLPTETIGRIQIRGRNVTQGYLFEDDNAGLFENGWLETGDLGFIHNENLYVTGRSKDLIISQGKNYFSHDIEECALECKETTVGLVSAVGIWNANKNEDEVILFVSLDEAKFEICEKIFEHISQSIGLQIKYVLPIKKSLFQKTSSGKPQRFKLKERYLLGEFNDLIQEFENFKNPNVLTSSIEEILSSVKEIWAEVLELDASHLSPDKEFHLLGGNSLKAVEIHHAIEEKFHQVFDLSILIHGSTIRKMSECISLNLKNSQKTLSLNVSNKISEPTRISTPKVDSEISDNDIAIIGTGIRVPGANHLDEFWELLEKGESHFSHPPIKRWSGYSLNQNIKRQTGSFLNDIDLFDSDYFGINFSEAQQIDPQQRLFLEVLEEALEDSGVKTSHIGLFASSGDNAYQARFLRNENLITHHTLLGSLKNMITGRASKVFDFQGPSILIDTACSSSLVAVHEACKSLRLNECEVAIAGGIQLYISPDVYSTFDKAGVLSKDGKSRPFDQDANGLVPGEGCGIVVLKRLKKAIQDGDHIHSIIKGSWVNNDGQSLNGTVPNPKGQRTAIEKVYQTTGVSTSTVGYVEAHAAGTLIGDTVEVGALEDVFRKEGERKSPCLIGSVKSNLGHGLSASGIFGLLKVVASLKNQKIPPTLNCQNPSSRIDFSSKIFRPVLALSEWPDCGVSLKRAALNSLGLGGTNIHMLLEDYQQSKQEQESSNQEMKKHMLFLSAPNRQSFEKLRSTYLELIDKNDSLNDICYTSAFKGKYFKHKKALIVDSHQDLKEKLNSLNPSTAGAFEKIAFTFPGPGTQYQGMGKFLFARMEVFRKHIIECHHILQNEFEIDLLDVLFDEKKSSIHNIDIAQIAVFSFGYSFAKYLISLGIYPDVVIGHSAGEYAAATIAGVMTLEEALKIVVKRGRYMAECPSGGMAAVFTTDEILSPLIKEFKQISIAAINGPRQIVISGDIKEIDLVLKQLDKNNISFKKLDIHCAAHSPLMNQAKIKLKIELEKINFKKPLIPFISSKEYGKETKFSSDYWTDHLTDTVDFNKAIIEATRNGVDLFLEVGATSSLSLAISQITQTKCLSFFDRNSQDEGIFLGSIKEIFEGGKLVFPEKLTIGGKKLAKIQKINSQIKKKCWVEEIKNEHQDIFNGLESCITDHVANGQPIAPAAMLIDYILYKSQKNITSLVIERSFAISQGERRLLRLNEIENDFMLNSQSENNGDQITHIQGQYANKSNNFQIYNLKKCEESFSTWYGPDDIYPTLSQHGLSFGKKMQSIVRVGIHEKELFVELKSGDINYEGYLIEPSLLDGAFQSLAAFGISNYETSSGYLGFSSGEIRFYEEVRNHCYAHIKLKNEFGPSSDVMRFDVVLFNDRGEILLEIDDFTAKRSGTQTELFSPIWEKIEVKANNNFSNYEIPLLSHVGEFKNKNILILNPSFDQLLYFCQKNINYFTNKKLFLISNENYLHSFFRNFAAENPSLFCRSILTESPLQEIIPFLTETDEYFQIKIHKDQVFKFNLTKIKPQVQKNLEKGIAIIFGGKGGIGLEISKELENQGLEVILAGRSFMNDKNYFQCDITNKFQLTELFNLISKRGSIKYVIHAAGILADAPVINLDNQLTQKVTAPKITGADNLIEVLSKYPKILKVLFISSLSSLVPSPGQAHYGAANEYQNDIVRKNPHLPLSSIAFGPWQESGMVKGKTYQERFEQLGLIGITNKEGVTIILNTLKGISPSIIAAIKFIPSMRNSLLSRFNLQQVQKVEETTRFEKSDSFSFQENSIEDYLKKIISERVKIKSSEINSNDTFQELGLDSLGAVTLVKKIEEQYGVKLYPTLFFEYKTIKLLSNYLTKEIKR